MNEDDGPSRVVLLSWALMIAFGASLLHLVLVSLQRWPTISTLVLFTPLRRYPGEPDGYR